MCYYYLETLKKNFEEVQIKQGDIKEKETENNADLKRKDLQILIQTVNDNEFHAAMCQLKNKTAIRYIVYDPMCDCYSYYNVGYWGRVKVAIVRTNMGPHGFGGSWYETRKALNCMPNLRFIFLVGVCGGRKDKGIHLGDVIVSKEIQGFDELKMIPGRLISRSTKSLCKGLNFYDYISKESYKPKQVKFEVVVSGPWLVADIEMQQKLWDMLPDGRAIEMEGAGVARAIEGKNAVECLVVKGVSDLADKEKTDGWQPQAATNAAEYLCEMINKAEHIFGMFGCE